MELPLVVPRYLPYPACWMVTVPLLSRDAALAGTARMPNSGATTSSMDSRRYLNDYLCTLLTYKKGKTAGVTRTFAQHSGELQAACGSYARAFKFLCGAADIPCFTVSTDNHTWNMVYVDGQWLHVDVSLNDMMLIPYNALHPAQQILHGAVFAVAHHRVGGGGVAGAVHQRLTDGVVERPVIGGGEHVRVGVLPTIQATEGMTDREKVEYLNDYLCTLLAYQKR